MMSTGNESFESQFPPEPSPSFAAYLEANKDVDPSTVVLLNHIPALIGGLKSNKFIVQEQNASPDTPPNPDARVDLSNVVVPSGGMAAFGDFFKSAEDQADAQYETALFETQQVLAEASGRDIDIKTLFIPDTVNSTASDYFRRLTRLSQDSGFAIAIRVVDYDDGDSFQYFKTFEPVRAASAADYWNQRANESRVLTDSLIYLGHYAPYTMEGVYEITGPPTAEALAAVALPTIRHPFVFTSFEQVQKDYPNSAFSDPAVWEAHKHEYELVSTEAEYDRIEQARKAEQDNLRDNIRRVAMADTQELRQLLHGDDAPFAEKLPVIREMAATFDDNTQKARIILAKLGDEASAQTILQEITDKIGSWGDESLTMAPLGIHLRHDEQLFGRVIDEVKETITEDPGTSERLLYLLGALYHSHDPRVGVLFANLLTIPERNVEAYASTVLHAAGRWMSEYTMALAYQPPSYQRDRALRTIETQTAAFIDAHNQGKLEGIHQHMIFGPDLSLLPLLFWFSNPAHRPILEQSVMRQFKEGGFILTDRKFEETYLLYRERYGDLPEISQHIRS
jgi:hypothetical protein